MNIIFDPATKREVKTAHMKQLKEHREKLYREPDLRQLFLELTLRCNERCLHCGSWCSDPGRTMPAGEELSVETYHRFLDKIRKDFDLRRMMLCITGGEPLLRKEFFEIMDYAGKLGFSWGMTTNGTLIGAETAARLKRAGMKTVSVSIDGLPETHDSFRQTPGAYERAMRGIQALLAEGGFEAVQVTTVVHHKNIGELDRLYEIMCGLDIDSWRVINMEPMGRALLHPELMMTPEDYRRLFSFIREKRQEGMPVEYGCSHYLGMDYEHEVREWYFLCSAGIYVASVMAIRIVAAELCMTAVSSIAHAATLTAPGNVDASRDSKKLMTFCAAGLTLPEAIISAVGFSVLIASPMKKRPRKTSPSPSTARPRLWTRSPRMKK